MKLKVRAGEERETVYMVMLPWGRSGGGKDTWMAEDEMAMREGGKTPSGAEWGEKKEGGGRGKGRGRDGVGRGGEEGGKGRGWGGVGEGGGKGRTQTSIVQDGAH